MKNEYNTEEPRREVYVPKKKTSGAGTALALIAAALLFIIGPFLLPQLTHVKVSGISQVIILGFGVILLLVGSIVLVITRLYMKTGANEAFVRTGMGGQKAVIDGGAVCIPVVHTVVPVSLETMKLQVKRTGGDALLTADCLRAIVHAEFFIRVTKNQVDVLAAATSLGNRCGNAQAVKDLVEEKLVSALRTVAATKSLQDLNAKRDDFASEVQRIVSTDLKHNGLNLESVTISQLDQAPPDKTMAETNVFDAQGLQKVTEITQKARVARRTIEVQADQDVRQKEVEKDKFIYSQDVIQAEAEAGKGLSISKAKAEAEAQAKKIKSEQDKLAGLAKVENEQSVALAEVSKDQAVNIAKQQQLKAVETAEIEKNRAVEIANVEKERTVQAANVERQKTVETATVEKEKTVEVTTREKEIAIAEAEQRRATAEAARVAAEIERTQKEQEKLTVEKTAEANRQKSVAVIGKESTARQNQIEQNMLADVKAYNITREAEAEQEAAVKKAVAKTTEADASKRAKEMEAIGDQAIAMVPVAVSQAQVAVEQSQVSVLKSKLEAQSANEKMAFNLQVEMTKIGAEKEIRIAMAQAVGNALAAARMTVYGDPGTVQKLVQPFFEGQAIGQYITGIAENTPKEVKDLVSGGLKGLASLASSALEKLLGKKVDPDVVEKALVDEALARSTASKK